jgi:ankyrin repeat protein
MPPSKKKKKRGKAAISSAAGQQWRRQPAGEVGDQQRQLVVAAHEGDGAAVARLLAAGANPSASVPWKFSGEEVQTNPLDVAALRGRLEVVRLLLATGTDPSRAAFDSHRDSHEPWCFTPLLCAAMGGHLEVLRLLLGRGAAVDAVHPETGRTAFHCACDHNHAECAEALAQAGCDVGVKDINGLTGRELAQVL